MFKAGRRSTLILISVFLFYTCIEPYRPQLGEYKSLLVVDGLITDSNSSYTVKLSKSFQDQNSEPEMVTNAALFITDINGNMNYLKNTGNGIYKTDSLSFKGVVGNTYVLHINVDGADYLSDPCLMMDVPEIDSTYFEKDNELVNNGTQSLDGIRIYIDSKAGDKNQFLRWSFDETWKFKVPLPKKYNFNIADSAITTVTDVKEYCWKSRKSSDILINSTYSQSLPIRKQPIFFIATDQSDRLLIQYSILIKQYSISKSEYDFWNSLKQINESGGDIFAKIPYTQVSNIKNVNDPNERIQGYFQVSSVKQRRKNITFSEIKGLNLPLFHYSCERIAKAPSDYDWRFPPTWAQIYSMFCVSSDYYFVEPEYTSDWKLAKMVFAKPECANCELTGTSKKPDFWVDLN